MKAKPYQVNALVPQIQKEFKGALVFGPDFGIVQEISEKIALLISSNLNDTFCTVKLTSSKVKEIPSILLDEGNSSPLLGGRKLIWLKEAENSIFDSIENYFNHIQSDAFLLISAGNLTKSSSLRDFCDSNKDILSIACYQDDIKDVMSFIREVLTENGYKVNSDALSVLAERLNENRLETRQELEKLMTYLGNNKQVALKDVLEVVTDTQNSSSDLFCMAVAGGDRERADKEYHLLLENGENPVSIVRILFIYFNKLLDGISVISQGGIEAGIKKVLKPAQFRLETSVRRQLQIWKKENILKTLNLLLNLERQIKSTGMPNDLILERVIFQITTAAKRSM